jgi:hypothetical protein
MDDQQQMLALSSKNNVTSLKDINKQSEKNEKKTLTQAQAMNKLADAMERMLKAGEPLTGGGGLLGALINGFIKGVTTSEPFMSMMYAIKGVIKEVFQFGKKLGDMFVNMFPGVKEVFGAITDFFNPASFNQLTRKLFAIFQDFLGDFKKGGHLDFGKLMDRIKEVFFDFFSTKEAAGSRLLDGLRQFGSAMLDIFVGAGEWIVKQLASIIDSVADWIAKPKIPKVNIDGSAILSPFEKLFDSLTDKLWPAIQKLAGVIWDKIVEGLKTPTGMKIAAGGLAVLLGPAIIQGVMGGMTGDLMSKVGGMLGGFMGQAAAAPEAAKAAKAATAGGGATVDMTKSPTAMVSASVPDEEQLKKMELAANSKISWGDLT